MKGEVSASRLPIGRRLAFGRAGPAKLRIGTHIVLIYVSHHAGSAGVDELHFHLPQDFPLRLYQAVLADTVNGDSNVLWIYLD